MTSKRIMKRYKSFLNHVQAS